MNNPVQLRQVLSAALLSLLHAARMEEGSVIGFNGKSMSTFISRPAAETRAAVVLLHAAGLLAVPAGAGYYRITAAGLAAAASLNRLGIACIDKPPHIRVTRLCVLLDTLLPQEVPHAPPRAQQARSDMREAAALLVATACNEARTAGLEEFYR